MAKLNTPNEPLGTSLRSADVSEWLKQIELQDYPTPFQLVSRQKLLKNIEILRKLLPRIEVFYAMKSASHSEVIKAVDAYVDGFDIASLGEYELLRSCGVLPARVLYSNPVKVPDHIQQTYADGVRSYAFDSLTEIDKLAKYAPGCDVYLRLKVSDYGSKFPLSRKFGLDPARAIEYMLAAQSHGLMVRGITFHVGSQSESPQTWRAALQLCGEVIAQAKVAGIHIDFVNIGGGLPVVYLNEIASTEDIAAIINESIDAYLPGDVRVVSEPGRFISASSSIIGTTIIGREHRGSEEWLFIDMGVFQGLMEPLEMQGWKYPIFTQKALQKDTALRPYVLTGPSCDAYDTLGFEYMLPTNLAVGDKLYIGMAGAYTSVYGSNFNGFKPPAQYFIK